MYLEVRPHSFQEGGSEAQNSKILWSRKGDLVFQGISHGGDIHLDQKTFGKISFDVGIKCSIHNIVGRSMPEYLCQIVIGVIM